jgi:hypothetical protein
MFVKRFERSDFADGNRPLLLSDVYAFARRRSGDENRLLKIKLKLLVLFGQTITFAGSTLLKDPFAVQLFDEMKPFFKEGYIIPDLRGEAYSFQHLAEIRRAEQVTKGIVSHAKTLDRDIVRVINFDSFEVSSLYSHGLAAYINEAAKQTEDSEELEQLLQLNEKIVTSKVPLTLDYVKDLAKTLKNSNDVKRMAELMYCVSGAEVVGAHTFLPGYFVEEKSLWGDLLPRVYFTSHEIKVIESLFEHYAIDVSRLEYLSPEEVIELRNDRRISDAIVQLRKIVNKASDSLVFDLSVADDYRQLLSHVAVVVNQLVKEACKREDRMEKVFYVTRDVVVDLANIPFSNIGARLVNRFVNWLGASHRTGPLGLSMTPLLTAATVLRDKLTGVNEHREIAERQLIEGTPRHNKLSDPTVGRKLLG